MHIWWLCMYIKYIAFHGEAQHHDGTLHAVVYCIYSFILSTHAHAFIDMLVADLSWAFLGFGGACTEASNRFTFAEGGCRKRLINIIQRQVRDMSLIHLADSSVQHGSLQNRWNARISIMWSKWTMKRSGTEVELLHHSRMLPRALVWRW